MYTRIAVVNMFLNAGETTRAIEIAKALRTLFKNNPESSCEIAFFSTMFADDDRVSYQSLVKKAGFDVSLVGKGYTNEEWKAIEQREHNGEEFYLPQDQARVTNSIVEMQQMMLYYGPELILHGFMHDLSGPVAAKVLKIPSISFCPIPMDVEWTKQNLLTDFPEDKRDEGPLKWLSLSQRRALLHEMAFDPSIPSFNTVPTCVAAALEAGWHPPAHTQQHGKILLQDMMDAQLNLVNDLPGNYHAEDIPARTIVTGPVFPNTHHGDDDQESTINDTNLLAFLKESVDSLVKKVFICMGSSGHAEHIVSALKAITQHPNADNYKVVAVVPPSMASLDDIRQAVLSDQTTVSWPSNIFLTNEFVPSSRLHAWADVSMIHGGHQGTVQTALASGTPVIGVDNQMEQAFNLENVARRGTGIHLSPQQWSRPEIVGHALDEILVVGDDEDSSYATNAQVFQSEIRNCDGAAVSAQIVYDFVHQHQWMQQSIMGWKSLAANSSSSSSRVSARG